MNRLIGICALTATLVGVPGIAWALGLGQVQSDTRIGETLEARIPILAADASAVRGLRVSLASAETYRHFGLRMPDFLYTLEFEVRRDARGPYVRVTSTEPVRLPFLNLLVRARWSSGEVTRQYTLLLNPPVFAAAESGADVAAPSTPTPQPMRDVREMPAQRPAVSEPAQSYPSPARYGPVRHGDTLWGIASRLRPDAGISVNQMMIALYRANPQAFSGNINRLRAGPTLRVPSRREIEAVSRTGANAEVTAQNRTWRAMKSRGETRLATARPSRGQAGAGGQGTGVNLQSPAETARAGEVVLTAPHVTATGTQAGTPVASARDRASDASQTVAKTDTRATRDEETASAAPEPTEAVGGPVKVNDTELAQLAAPEPKAEKLPAAEPPHPSASVTTPDTAERAQSESILWNWLTTPKGWIVIALIVLLIALPFLLYLRRARMRRLAVAQAEEGAPEPVRTGAASARVTPVVAGAPMAAASVEEEIRRTKPGAAPVEAIKEGPSAERQGAEEEMETDFTEPPPVEPTDEFAFTQAPDAAGLHPGPEERTDAGEEETPADAATIATEETHALDLDFELDQLGGAQKNDAQDDFERTLGELSTMIETYLPEDGGAPIALQLPPSESDAAESEEPAPEESGQETSATATPEAGDRDEDQGEDKPPLEFTLDDEADASAKPADTGHDTTMEYTGEGLSPEGEAESGVETAAEEDESATDLELARAYLDLGDRDSARDILKGEATASDPDRREAARRMLEELEADDDSRPAAETGAGEPGDTPSPETSADEADNADTQLDLARAYLDLGDREAARDILEEILDQGDEARSKAARALLDTLNA